MSLPSKDTKENFRLLDLSSEDLSDDLQLEIIPSRKRKITRRDRNRIVQHKSSESTLVRDAQCIVAWAVRGCLLIWLLLLTLTCATLYDQMNGTRLSFEKVSTSSDSVEDALQQFHTAAKELRANASDLSNRMAKLEQEHLELSKRVEKALGELASVSAQLNAAPELREIPQRLSELQKTVGGLGSQINGFDGAIATARKQAVTAVTGVDEVKTLLHQLEARTNETITNVTDNGRHGDELRQQVLALNSTLEAKVEALRTRIEELTRPTTTTAAPTSSTPTTSSTTTSTSTTATPAPTTTQGQPVKPNITQ